MTKKEKLRELARNEPIIHAGFIFHEHNGASWEEALELMVEAFADKCSSLEKSMIHMLSSTSMPPG